MTETHECDCNRDWREISFTGAKLEPGRGLVLFHDCAEHPRSMCEHVLGLRVADMIREAVT